MANKTSAIPKVRAAIIAFALVIHGLLAAPLPQPVSKRDFKGPVSAQEVEKWHELATAVGWEMTDQEFQDLVMTVSNGIGETHVAMEKPIKKALRITGTGQGWALFAVPDAYPHRLEIQGKRSGDRNWHFIYRRHDPEFSEFLGSQINYRRVRGIYDGSSRRPGRTYKNFTKWVAVHAFNQFPELTEVRVRMIRAHTTIPGEEPDPETKVRNTRRYTREKLMP